MNSLKLSHFLLYIVCSFSSLAWAQSTESSAASPTFAQVFQQGGKSYQAKDFSAAKSAFEQALQLEPRSEAALTNLALTHFQLGQKGLALGTLRRALKIDPDFSTPRAAYAFIYKQLPIKEIPHEIQWFEQLRESFLNQVTLNTLLGLTALFLFSFGWLGLRYWSERRAAIDDERSLPRASFTWTFSTVGFLALLLLSSLKIYDQSQLRGTIITEKVAVKSAPDQNSPDLFELYEGLEVVIENTRDSWIQVTYPGALSGWIPKENLFLHEVK